MYLVDPVGVQDTQAPQLAPGALLCQRPQVPGGLELRDALPDGLAIHDSLHRGADSGAAEVWGPKVRRTSLVAGWDGGGHAGCLDGVSWGRSQLWGQLWGMAGCRHGAIV